MTEDVIQSASSPPEQHLLRGWRSVMFAPVGSGQRRRRGSDGVRLAAAVLVLVCCLLVIRYDSRIDRAITQVIHPPPWSITWLVTVVYQAGSFGVAVVLVATGPARAPLGGRARHRAERGRDGGGVRDPDRLARKPRRTAGRDRDRRLLHELSRPADRPVHGGRHGGAAVSGARRAAPHRDLHRPGGPGLSRRRSRAAAQRAGEPGHRLGGDGGGPARFRLAARPALGRGRPAAARGVRHPLERMCAR